MTDQRTPRPRRPRPLDWAAVEALGGRAQAIAKGWLLLLLERAPLEAVGTIPAAALAAEGPALCAAVVRALGSDGDVQRLRPDGELAVAVRRIGAMTGAPDGAATVAAVDALRACVWEAALDGPVERGDAAELRVLAERLAEVVAVVAATAVGEGAADEQTAAPSPFPEPSPLVAEISAEPHPAPAIRDLRDAPPRADVDAEPGRAATSLPMRPETDPRDGPAATMDDGDLWIETLDRHIDRCQREGGGLALLRVELVDAERVIASAPEGQAGVPYGRLAQAIRRAIRRQDLVASDHQGRAWVIAPGVGRAGAVALAERIGAGVEDGEPWHGEPLAATIGCAVYGEDGRDAVTLIDRAEEAMLAASAAGLRVGDPIPGSGDPDRPGPRLVP
jgi:GGDEF domain-containing protein